MSNRPWYKRYPSDFIAGTLQLSCEEKGAYSVVIDLMYDMGGPIPDDAQWISRVCNLSTRRWNQIRTHLLELGKITVDGHVLKNTRVLSQLKVEEKEHISLSSSGKLGAEKINELRGRSKENNDLEEKGPSQKKRHTRNQSPDRRKTPLKEVPPTDNHEVSEAVESWNRLAKEIGLAEVQRITPKRRASCRARLRECGGMKGWLAALGKIRDSPFLRGRNDRGWRADFDFVIREGSFTKIMEGGHDAKQKPNVYDWMQTRLKNGNDGTGETSGAGPVGELGSPVARPAERGGGLRRL